METLRECRSSTQAMPVMARTRTDVLNARSIDVFTDNSGTNCMWGRLEPGLGGQGRVTGRCLVCAVAPALLARQKEAQVEKKN